MNPADLDLPCARGPVLLWEGEFAGVAGGTPLGSEQLRSYWLPLGGNIEDADRRGRKPEPPAVRCGWGGGAWDREAGNMSRGTGPMMAKQASTPRARSCLGSRTITRRCLGVWAW